MTNDQTPDATTPDDSGRSIGRRSLLVGGGAGIIAGAGLIGASRASAAPTTSTSSSTVARGAAAAASRRKLTPEQQAGQRVIWSYPGLTPPTALLDAIRAGIVGGVIFFGENIDKNNRVQIQTVTKQLAQAQKDSGLGVPLLLNTDQEGGVVQRLPGAPGISNKQVGASLHPDSTATTMGTGAALNLLDAGVPCNLAPVLDVFRQTGNFDDQFGRSYSMDPRVCGRLGAESVKAQQKLGVITTAKHFPGLGLAPAGANTDLAPVVLEASAYELRKIDELPFKTAIDADVDMIMTSWATYPAFDPNLPAGLSPAIVQGELRGRLGYTGVTITDAIEAGSLSKYGDTGARSVLAAKAGMDIILCSGRDVAQGQAAVDALTAAAAAGELDAKESDRALARVLSLRGSLR